MKKFIVAIEETVVEEFEIKADTAEQALEIAEEKYKKGDIILKSGEVHFKQMAIIKPVSEATDWIEF